jgi:hypothetical protein
MWRMAALSLVVIVGGFLWRVLFDHADDTFDPMATPTPKKRKRRK